MKKECEFMLCFGIDQLLPITRTAIDFTYYPTYCKSYLITRECTPLQLRRLMKHNKNQEFSFNYGGATIEDFTVDFDDDNIAVIDIEQKFPGYEADDLNKKASRGR